MRKYTGNTDGVSATGAKAGTTKLGQICKNRWGFSNLGIFANRRMRNPAADKDPNNPKWLSVHATGRAIDLGYTDRKVALQAWDWLIANTAALQIEEIHDYAFNSVGEGKNTAYGRGYRCSRGEGKKGIKVFTATENAGSFGGKWLHIEISPEMANNPDKLVSVWKSLPKPAGI